jgi:hypothetical protein
MFSFISGLIPAALQVALLVVLSRRKLSLQFPFFFTYTAYSVAATFARLCLLHRPMTFFIVYWVTEMIYGVLALLAILEVFKPTLGAYFEPMWGRWMPALTLWEWLGFLCGGVCIIRSDKGMHWGLGQREHTRSCCRCCFCRSLFLRYA